jgi:phage-related protein
MAYNNEFFYDRDNSVDSKYKYVDLTSYSPIYGSSISYESRLNFLQTIDNSLKILPASENNLNIKYTLKFLLKDSSVGDLLKTIEIAGATRYLKFKDPSSFYKAFVGYVEKYSVNKTSLNFSEVNIDLSNYGLSPEFNWSRSSFFNIPYNYFLYSGPNVAKPKHSIVYYSNYDFGASSYVDANTPPKTASKISNFWWCKKDHNAESYNAGNFLGGSFYKNINTENWTKNFYFETKYPFILENEIDVYRMDYKNSFIQNVKYKQNTNVLKQFSLRFENISDDECKAMLLFLEKKCGYRRFIYEFPEFMKKHKVFVCNRWNHSFKYQNSHDVTLQLIEDPNPNVKVTPNGNYFLI